LLLKNPSSSSASHAPATLQDGFFPCKSPGARTAPGGTWLRRRGRGSPPTRVSPGRRSTWEAPPPAAATWMWFDSASAASVRMMFGSCPPTPTMGDPTQLAVFQMYSFTRRCRTIPKRRISGLYAPQEPTGPRSFPVTFIQSPSGVGVGTSLALADYYFYASSPSRSIQGILPYLPYAQPRRESSGSGAGFRSARSDAKKKSRTLALLSQRDCQVRHQRA
jgi:hypothetical protein